MDLTQKYLKQDNLLILHLTDKCNNRCGFCMVNGIHGAFVFPYEEAVALIHDMPAGAKVDLFGGEPTLHPRFLDLLRQISDRRLICSVATNGRRFANGAFSRNVLDITGKGLYVRTSLHGRTADVHDRVTGVDGSFEETLSGIRQVIALGMTCQVNIVVTWQTLPVLEDMVRFIAKNGVPMVKFGLIVDVRSCPHRVPPLATVRPELESAVEAALELGLRVTVEKAPLCLLPGRISHFSSEWLLGKWPRAYDDTGACAACVVRNWCDGLDPGYAEIFGTDGLQPMTRIDRQELLPFPETYSGDHLQFLKLNVVAMPPPTMDQEAYEPILLHLMEEAETKHARIAFVDNHIVR